jgi:hypothetical protein
MHTIQNKIYLHVITYNKDAISFYGRSGFQCVRELPDYYCVNHNLYNSYLCIRHIAGASPPVRFRWFRRFAKSVMNIVYYIRHGWVVADDDGASYSSGSASATGEHIV